MEVVQTIDHRLIFNESGVLAYTADEELEENELDHTQVQEFQYQEMLAITEFVNANRDRFVQVQQQLECTWRAVADEVIESMEAEHPGSAADASIQETQRVLSALASAPHNQRGIAGQWYQPVLTKRAFPRAFFQQWIPFLRILHQRKVERFPTILA